MDAFLGEVMLEGGEVAAADAECCGGLLCVGKAVKPVRRTVVPSTEPCSARSRNTPLAAIAVSC